MRSAKSAPKSEPNEPRKTARQWKMPMPKHRRRRIAPLTRLRVGKRKSSSPQSKHLRLNRFQQGKQGSRLRLPFLHSGKLHSRHSSRKAWFTHLLEHFFHLSVLAEQVVDFLHAGSRTPGNPFAAAPLCGFVLVPPRSPPLLSYTPPPLIPPFPSL